MMRGQVHEDVEAEPEHGHQRPDQPAVAALQELRHRVDVVLEEDRQEELADDQKRRRRHPFVGRDRKPDRIARARHADDLLGRDVGGDERGADRPPGQILRRQEIIRRVLLVSGLLARHILGEAEDADRVDNHDEDIECRKAHAKSPVPRALPIPNRPPFHVQRGADLRHCRVAKSSAASPQATDAGAPDPDCRAISSTICRPLTSAFNSTAFAPNATGPLRASNWPSP